MKVRLRVQNPERNSPVFEDIPAEARSDGLVTLLNSPTLVENVAAGDVVRLHADHTFDVVTRGGNVCVQFLRANPPVTSAEANLTADVARLGGCLDAVNPGILVYTIPLRGAGFPAIEAALARAVASGGDGCWMYGNVYDPSDGRPLNWWE